MGHFLKLNICNRFQFPKKHDSERKQKFLVQTLGPHKATHKIHTSFEICYYGTLISFFIVTKLREEDQGRGRREQTKWLGYSWKREWRNVIMGH
jgi:hypothetical protein